MRKRFRLIMLASAMALAPSVACAHAVLKSSSPAPGAVLSRAPPEIRLSFNEKIEARVSKIDVSADNGAKVDAGPVRADPKKSTDIVLTLPALQPGRYRVQWRAISVDTHPIQGSFEFEVRH